MVVITEGGRIIDDSKREVLELIDGSWVPAQKHGFRICHGHHNQSGHATYICYCKAVQQGLE